MGTAINVVTPAVRIVPMIAWYAPPPALRGLTPAWELVHHCDCRTRDSPLVTTVQRIQTRGTSASTKAAWTATVATRSASSRRPPTRPPTTPAGGTARVL